MRAPQRKIRHVDIEERGGAGDYASSHASRCHGQRSLTHLYVAVIAVLLMYLHTGHRPSKYMFALLSQVAAGAATLEDILSILRERERRKELDRLSAVRRRATTRAAR